MPCYQGAASSHKNDPPVTTANEAYGVHSPPVSMEPLSLAAPVYERVDTECVKIITTLYLHQFSIIISNYCIYIIVKKFGEIDLYRVHRVHEANRMQPARACMHAS